MKKMIEPSEDYWTVSHLKKIKPMEKNLMKN